MITSKKELRKAIWAMAQGAAGHCTLEDAEDCGFLFCLGAKSWLQFVAAIKVTYGDECHDHVFELHNLHHFDEIEDAVEAIWRGGLPKEGGGQ